jgi:hypothetical protein
VCCCVVRGVHRLVLVPQLVKEDVCGRFHGTWHCIVGKSFGSMVTHETGKCVRWGPFPINPVRFRCPCGLGCLSRLVVVPSDRLCPTLLPGCVLFDVQRAPACAGFARCGCVRSMVYFFFGQVGFLLFKHG